MRKQSELSFLVNAALKTSGGKMPIEIAAEDEAEAEALQVLLKGRHGAKVVDVKVYGKEWMKPIATAWAEEEGR